MNNSEKREHRSEGKGMTRREFDTTIAAGMMGLTAAELTSLLANDKTERMVDKTTQFEKDSTALQGLRKNPHEFIGDHRKELMLEKNAPALVGCIDERALAELLAGLREGIKNKEHLALLEELVKNPAFKGVNIVNLPGSGFYLANGDAHQFTRSILSELHSENTIGISCHAGCAACGNDNEKAKKFAKAEAEDLHVPYVGMLEKIEPKEYHPAMGACSVYDKSLMGVSRILPHDISKYFGVSQWAVKGQKERLMQAELTAKIAFGDHGLNDLLTEEKPFQHLVLCTKQTEQIARDEADLLMKNNPYGKRFRNDIVVL